MDPGFQREALFRSNSMSITVERKTSSEVRETIMKLAQVSRESNSVFWRDIAERISGGRRRYASVDLGKIERLCAEGDTVVVPGTVLGGGEIEKKITISAIRASTSAIEKIGKSGSTFKKLSDLAIENPKGTNIKIIR